MKRCNYLVKMIKLLTEHSVFVTYLYRLLRGVLPAENHYQRSRDISPKKMLPGLPPQALVVRLHSKGGRPR